ncbi:MAG TPA: uroporphyrinogen-III C-methyltransferase [Bryobacteraceae bacterium]|nr:uroporphyrinogen-III C-methyltransferase [Bryobacteraceae bacterium]
MKVYLVGAGPGDPGLITLKGRKVLERADCVLYDNLASEKLLCLAPARAERIYVGKKRAKHEMSQQEISALMVDRARKGRIVVRLKGGDPFIFGRGGEEAEALAASGIPFEIVPGVTAALGLAAYTGVPLTHREHTSAVTFVTGHRVEAIDWARVGATETIVLFMGLVNFPAIARELIAHGRAAETPAMAVRWATRPDQQTLVGTLATLPDLIAQKELKPPATIVVGEVVALRDRFNWFEHLPLFGKRIVVTRDRRQAAELSGPLEELGAEVILLPAIEIRPAEDLEPLDAAIARLRTYDWIVFTSVNGVKHFLERLDASRRDLRAISAKLCAIGPATRAAIEALHLKVDLTPEQYVAESLVAAFTEERLAGRRILIPRAAVARDLIPVELTRRGAHVDVVEAYRTVAPADLAEHAAEVLAREPDWISFTSSSTVKNIEKAAEPGALQGIKIASIGPITSQTIRECGLDVDAEADPHTVQGLVDAIVKAT